MKHHGQQHQTSVGNFALQTTQHLRGHTQLRYGKIHDTNKVFVSHRIHIFRLIGISFGDEFRENLSLLIFYAVNSVLTPQNTKIRPKCTIFVNEPSTI